tara:strand:- start:33 stop:974 length:942 start_codon:yes stop_codon:yes gene_type:complete
MKTILNWIKNNPNRFMFLIPILLVAAISISHVVTWYDIANPINWAIYLSIAIEIGAMTALVAATNQIKGGVWFMFGLVTFIQMIGNIFYSYKEIDETGELFKSWVELTGPIWESLGTELTDTVGLKRYLAYLEGGLLPIISLTSLHFFVKYEKKEEEVDNSEEKYFNSRNKHIEKLVSDREQKEYNPMTEHPQDIYHPPSKNEKTEIPLSVPEGKEFNVAYPITDEIMEEISQIPKIDIEEDDIEERTDNQIKKYLPDTEVGKVEETKVVIENDDIVETESIDDPEEVEKEIIMRKIVKQPPKPPKTKINRID